MPNVNIVVLGGFLTRDPELRYAQSGTAIVNFTVAVNHKWKTESGEEKEEATFTDCTAFGKTAETISQYFRKGGAILIQGRLKQERWEDKKTRQPRSKIAVTVGSFNFCGDSKAGKAGSERGDDDDDDSNSSRARRSAATATRAPATSDQVAEDDVPF